MQQLLTSFLIPWFEKCVAIDPDFVLYPWKEEDHISADRLPVISKASNIPSVYTLARRYFNNLKELYEGGAQHVSVWLGGTMSLAELRINLQSWLTHTSAGLYDRTLQVENTSLVGFLLFSTGQTHVARLQEALTKQLGFPVECKWRQIRQPDASGSTAGQAIVKAIHVIVDKRNETEALEALQELYGSKSKNHPLKITMRFFPTWYLLSDDRSRAKCREARRRQELFTLAMVESKTWEIVDLYTPNSKGHSLRSLLMGIKSTIYPEDSLFHTIDSPPRSTITLMVHHPDDNAQAHQVKSGLLPFLCWKLRKHYNLDYAPCSEEENTFFHPILYKFFTAQSVLRAVKQDWDEEKQEVTSTVADELEASLEADPKYKKLKAVAVDMTPVQNQSQMRRPTAKGALKQPKGYRTRETDSISTVHPYAGTEAAPQVSAEDRSFVSGHSIVTAVTKQPARTEHSLSPSERSAASATSARSQSTKRSSTSSVTASTLNALSQKLDIMMNTMGQLGTRLTAMESPVMDVHNYRNVPLSGPTTPSHDHSQQPNWHPQVQDTGVSPTHIPALAQIIAHSSTQGDGPTT
jgi:hypothetical protein